MDSVLGGGVLLAVAATLWLVYLVPNWLRRSEYLATERNAVRLQQTIRVLAETAETPEAVRLENAAQARAYEARLREEQAMDEAAHVAEAPVDPGVRARARLRRTRVVTTVVVAIAALVLVSQLVVALAGGFAAASAPIVIASTGITLGGLWLQGRLVKATRRLRTRAASTTLVEEAAQRPSRNQFEYPEVEVDPRAWTPQPLPAPLDQVRREAAIRAAIEAERTAAAREAEERRVAAVAASLVEERHSASLVEERPNSSLVDGRPNSSVVEERPKAASRNHPAGTPSRFAAMGVVTDLVPAALDLEGALARRRAS